MSTAATFAPQIEAAGLEPVPSGIEPTELERRFAPVRAELPSIPIPLRRRFVFTRRFARIESPARLDGLREVARAFEPDLLVHESAELAAPVVAAELGLPSAHHSFGRMVSWAAIDAAAADVLPMWEHCGVAPEPHCGLFRGAYVDIAPPSLASERPPDGTRVLPRRAVDARAAERSARPLVYVTLGTVVTSTATLASLLEGVADLDVDVLLTTGWQNDPADLGAIPANATVERFVPQEENLPRCSLIVTHAGSGSTLGALAHGVPILAVPHAADQFENADAVTSAGAGRVVMPDELSPATVNRAAHDLLEASSYREAAERVAAEIAAMPSAAEVAATLSAAR